MTIRMIDYMEYGDFFHRDLLADCEEPWQALKRLEAYVAAHAPGDSVSLSPIPDGATVASRGVRIGEGVVIEPGVCIIGPAIIGDGVILRHGAYLRENVLLGAGVKVGHASEIKHSILLNGARAPHFNYVGDSILGVEVNLGAGAICSNYKNVPFGGEVTVNTGSEKIATGLRSFGAVIGDHAKIGCNSVLNPGTVVGRHVQTYPGVMLRGVIPAHQLIKRSQ